MIRRRRRNSTGASSLEELAAETSELVARLLREHRVLRAENESLKREVERLAAGWEDVKKLARLAPRRRRPTPPPRTR
jgi:hypothetical protein